MKTLERLHEYKDYIRTEVRTEECELFEDLLLLAKLSENAAQAAYAFIRCTEEKKKAEGKALLTEQLKKVKEQYTICEGYGGFDG